MGKFKHATKSVMSKTVALSMVLSSLAPAASVFAATDISGHWAEKTISSWQERGLIGGYEDGSFKPNNAISRAEMVRIINQSLGFTGGSGANFSDVSPSDWYYNDVAIAVEKGYCNGFPDGTFRPNDPVTREQAAVFISNARGLTANAQAADSLADAAALPDWAKGAIGAVVGAGFMSGYPDGTFQSGKAFTRAEAVSTLDRVIGNTSYAETSSDQNQATKEETQKPSTYDGAYTMETADEKLINQTIDGDLVVSDKIGNGTVTLENVTVTGDLVI